MDLDELIHREGEERAHAAVAICERSREAHLVLAEMFRVRIAFRRAMLFKAAFGTPSTPPVP